uniref:Putative adenylate cyclase n=1 Tax=Ornithodoros turicata TaxID=34597 RepID=A0A2R5LLF4_9ACAR
MEGGLYDEAGDMLESYVRRSCTSRMARYRRRFREFFAPHGLHGTVRNLTSVTGDIESEGEHTDTDNRSRCKKVLDFVVGLKLEAFFFFYTLAYTVQYAASANLMEAKACYLILNKTEEICKDLEHHDKEMNEVRNVSNLYMLYVSLVGFLPGALVTLLVGSWCDAYGRFKVPMCVSILGVMMKVSGNLVTAVYAEAPVYYNMISAIPEGIFGGLPAVLMSSYVLTAASCPPDKRTTKFFLIQIAFILAFPTGQLVSALTYQKSGLVPLFAASLGLFAFSLLWTVFVIKDVSYPEERSPGSPGAQSGSSRPKITRGTFLQLLTRRHFFGSLRAVLARSTDVDRFRVPLLVLSVFLLVLNSQTSFISYFYARSKFQWTFSKYVIISSAFSLASVVVITALLLLFLRWMPANQEYGLAMIGLAGVGFQNALHAASGSVGQPLFLLGHGFGMLSNIAPACVRAHVSKLLPEDEHGRVFSVMATFEALAPLLGRFVLWHLFGISKHFFAGLSFVMSFVLVLVPLAVLIYFWRKRNMEYHVVAEDCHADEGRT